MDIKSLLEKHYKNKKEMCKFLGVSYYTLTKYEKDPESIPQEIIDKLKTISEKDDNKVSISFDIPELTYPEYEFYKSLHKNTLEDKFISIGFARYILTSEKSYHPSKKAMLDGGKDPYEVLTRLSIAVLTEEFVVKKEDTTRFVVLLPTGHYLAKYSDNSTGYSVAMDSFTVVAKTRKELELSYPEYKDFIVQISERNEKRFTINERKKA